MLVQKGNRLFALPTARTGADCPSSVQINLSYALYELAKNYSGRHPEVYSKRTRDESATPHQRRHRQASSDCLVCADVETVRKAVQNEFLMIFSISPLPQEVPSNLSSVKLGKLGRQQLSTEKHLVPSQLPLTISNTFAPSNLPLSSTVAGGAATRRETEKRRKYSELMNNFIFIPVTIETSGTWGIEGLNFIKEIGQRINRVSQNPKSTAFLIQRISITLQRFHPRDITSRDGAGGDISSLSFGAKIKDFRLGTVVESAAAYNRRFQN
ncbi:hypothetical protein C0J52_14321 [Blattella germanica]|nr:hypothetical protein C0J52_14321 [Blattella germanica]